MARSTSPFLPGGTGGWVRLGTISGGFQAIDTSAIEKSNLGHPLVQFAPFELEINGEKSSRHVDESTGLMDLGDLRLSNGIVLRARVVDADGKPVSGVALFTSAPTVLTPAARLFQKPTALLNSDR